MEIHPLDEARDGLLRGTDPATREILKSKLHVVTLARDDAAGAGLAKMSQEHAARGVLNSSATIGKAWELALAQGKTALSAILDACLEVGVSADEDIARFASEDLKHFLRSFMTSRFGHGDASSARAAANLVAQAEAHASRVPHELKSRRFDFERKSQPISSSAVKREKHQKFGILDAPNLLTKDLSQSAGLLGRVLIYLDVDNFKSVNTRLTERVVDRAILPELHRIVDKPRAETDTLTQRAESR